MLSGGSWRGGRGRSCEIVVMERHCDRVRFIERVLFSLGGGLYFLGGILSVGTFPSHGRCRCELDSAAS